MTGKNEQKHLNCLRQVCERLYLYEAGYKLNLEKYCFFSALKHLGHIIDLKDMPY